MVIQAFKNLVAESCLPKHYISHAISGIERQLGHARIIIAILCSPTLCSPTQQNIFCIGTKELRISMARVIQGRIIPRGIKDLLGFGVRSTRVACCRIAGIEGVPFKEDDDPRVQMRRPENITGTVAEIAGGYGSYRGLVLAPASAIPESILGGRSESCRGCV